MAKLFDNVPRRFFNPLAVLPSSGSQQQFYAECLLMINSLFSQTAQVSRDELKSSIVDLILADHIESLEDDGTEGSQDKSASGKNGKDTEKETPQPAPGQTREDLMANHVLSYLSDEEVGWLEEGIDSRTFGRTYMITEQGMLLADYIQKASSMKLDEMSNYLYNTYLALDDFSRHQKERAGNNPYTLVIVNAFNNIKALNSSLKMLRRSIKRIVQKVTGRLTFQQLMDNLGDYIDGDFIGEFTRLVDSENAALFRGPITAMLRKLMQNSRTRNIFVLDCMKAAKEEQLTYEQAQLRIDEQTAYIEDFLTDGYPAMVREIRNQMVEYIMTVRLKLKMTMDIAEGSQEVLGQFIRQLSAIPADQATPAEMLEVFRILDNSYVSPSSVRYANRRRGRLQNAAGQQRVLSEEEIREEQEKMRRMQDVPFTREKMKAYGDKYKVNGMIRATGLPLATKDEVLSDVATASFATANGMDVKVDDDYIKSEQVTLRDFTLKDVYRTGNGTEEQDQ